MQKKTEVAGGQFSITIRLLWGRLQKAGKMFEVFVAKYQCKKK